MVPDFLYVNDTQKDEKDRSRREPGSSLTRTVGGFRSQGPKQRGECEVLKSQRQRNTVYNLSVL
jgi:hypothetical protein